jgi:cilia- and flagella-associated protein 57
LNRLDEVHSSTMVEIEAQYERKLRVEMERFDRLSEEIERVQQHCEELIGAQQDEHKRLLKAHDAEARRVEKELRGTVERLTEDEKHNAATFKEVLDQQEQEYEAELQALMLAAQTELSAERSSTSRMRVMVQERNATIDGLKKRGEELKTETHRQDIALADHKLRNAKLEATLEHFKRHMVERESTLADKEKAIMDLRRTNTTLDNFRFVLDHRVQQLLEERAPISGQINELEEHIDSMYDELEKEYQSKQIANQEMDSKGMKINTLATEVLKTSSKKFIIVIIIIIIFWFSSFLCAIMILNFYLFLFLHMIHTYSSPHYKQGCARRRTSSMASKEICQHL